MKIPYLKDSHEVAQAVRDGSYFEHAKIWYQDKYMMPAVERTLFIFITIMALMISYSAIKITGRFLPLAREVPVMTGISDAVSTYTTIKSLAIPNIDDSDAELMKYLAMHYIRAFETYDYSDKHRAIKRNFNIIRQLSDDGPVQQFRSYMSPMNRDGMALRYRYHTKRFIEFPPMAVRFEGGLTKEELDEQRKKSDNEQLKRNKYKLEVRFNALEENVKGTFSTPYKAVMLVEYGNIEYEEEARQFFPLHFKVLEYESQAE